MNIRQKNLFNYLLKSPYFKPIDEYAHLLNCSEKTIRNDLKVMDDFIQEHHLDIELKRQRGKGVYLLADEEAKESLHQLIHVEKLEIEPNLFRIYRGIDILLNAEEPVTIDEFAERMYTNPKIIQSELKVWESMLPKFQLTFSRKDGIELLGEEANIRLFSMFYFYRLAFLAMNKKLEKKIVSKNKHFFQSLLTFHEQAIAQRFTNNAFNQLIIYLDMMVKRIKIHKYVTIKDDEPLTENICTIGKQLSTYFQIDIPKSELLFLQKMFHSSTKQEELNELNRFPVSPLSKQLIQHLSELLKTHFHLTITTDIQTVLENSIDIALIRANNQILVLNVVGNQTKYEFLEAYLTLLYLFTDDPLLQKYPIFDMDFARLAMIIQPELEKKKSHHYQYKAAMVVNNGIEQAYYGREQIEKYFKSVNICYTISSSSIRHIENKVDFFISFEYLQTTSPFVVLSNMIKNDDLVKFYNFLDDFQRKRQDCNFLDFKEVSTYIAIDCEDNFLTLLNKILTFLLDEGIIIGDYERIKRILLSSYFIHKKKVVIPYFSHDVRVTSVYYHPLPTNSYVEGHACNTLFVILISEADKDYLSNLTSEVYNRIIIEK